MFSVPHVPGDTVATRNANRLAEVMAAFKEAQRDLNTASSLLGEYLVLLTEERTSILDALTERGRPQVFAQNVGERVASAQRRMNDANEEILRLMVLAGGFEND